MGKQWGLVTQGSRPPWIIDMGTIIGSVTTISNTSLVLRLSHPTFSILREHKSPKINLKYQVLHILSSRGLNVTLKLVLKNKYDFVLSTKMFSLYQLSA